MLRPEPKTPARPRARDLMDRMVRRILVPVLFAIGLYGLIRYLATGQGETSAGFPAKGSNELTAR